MKVNKFDLMNRVLVSCLRPQDKALLVELILRADDEGLSWPGVERLCQARGMKHTKNFKGAETYLPGLVTVTKRGRKNFYVLNAPAIEGLSEAAVTSKTTAGTFNTPAAQGSNTPAVADNTPAVADNTPAVDGANSSVDNTKESSVDSSPTVASAPVEIEVKEEQSQSPLNSMDHPSFEVEKDRPSLVLLGAAQTPRADSSISDWANEQAPADAGFLAWLFWNTEEVLPALGMRDAEKRQKYVAGKFLDGCFEHLREDFARAGASA